MPERAALAGRRIVVTRARAAGEQLATRLRDLGAIPLIRPLIAIAPPDDLTPLDAALRELRQFEWLVCTSANAVAALHERLQALGLPKEPPSTVRVGAVGSATAAAFRANGWRVDNLPATYTAAGLAEAFGDLTGQRVLFPASAIARPTLAEGLRARGATVEMVTAYRTVILPLEPGEPLVAALQDDAINAVTLTSPSTVRGFLPFLAASGRERHSPALVCVGPTTADAAREAGLTVSAIATEQDASGLIAALCALFDRPATRSEQPRNAMKEVHS
jgi:uroporphyrinogen-III synthase